MQRFPRRGAVLLAVLALTIAAPHGAHAASNDHVYSYAWSSGVGCNSVCWRFLAIPTGTSSLGPRMWVTSAVPQGGGACYTQAGLGYTETTPISGEWWLDIGVFQDADLFNPSASEPCYARVIGHNGT